jgi:hypothetical protein
MPKNRETSRLRILGKFRWGLLVRLALSIFVGWFLLDLLEESTLWWPQKWPPLDSAWLTLAAGLSFPYFYFRAIRLRSLLVVASTAASAQASKEASKETSTQQAPDRYSVLASGAMAFFWTWLLPLRLGEVTRPMLLHRYTNHTVTLPVAIGAVVIERLVDALIVALMALGIYGVSFDPSRVVVRTMFQATLVAASGLLALSFAGLLVLSPLGRRLLLALRKIVPDAWRAAKWVDDVMRFIEPAQGLLPHAFRRGSIARGLRFLASTAIYWVVTVAQVVSIAKACAISLGFPAAAALVGLVGLAIQIPAGPGQLGTHQVGTYAAITLLADEATELSVPAFLALSWLFPMVTTLTVALLAWIWQRFRGD